MLPNHAPLVIAEQFGTLESLYPGRIDLGLGRAPGTDQRRRCALRRAAASTATRFPRRRAWSCRRTSASRVRARRSAPCRAPDSTCRSGCSARACSARSSRPRSGLPFAFASHFAPDQLMQALGVYRAQFTPSATLDAALRDGGRQRVRGRHRRRGAAPVHLAAAAVRQPAARPAGPAAAAGRQHRTGSGRRPSSAMRRARLRLRRRRSPDAVRRRLEAFIERTGADELMVTAQIFDHAARAALVRDRREPDVEAALIDPSNWPSTSIRRSGAAPRAATGCREERCCGWARRARSSGRPP